VLAELEKLGPKYRIALRVARDPRFERLPCSHKGTYADDCIVDRVTSHKCYMVATCDRELRRRIRKIPVSGRMRWLRLRTRTLLRVSQASLQAPVLTLALQGIPLMYIAKHQYRVERLPDQGMAN
jgi:U3 small nucleolar RNA-associated protein 24